MDFSKHVSNVVDLDFITNIGETNCSLRGNHCDQVLLAMMMLLSFQLAFVVVVATAQLTPLRTRITEGRRAALVDGGIHANTFLVLLLFAPISKKLASLVDCTRYNDLHVLTAHKTLACGEGVCRSTSAAFFCLYTIGVPLYVFATLGFHLSHKGRALHKGSPMQARCHARFGFVCGRYEAAFWYYELLEMARRALLVSTGVFLQRGPCPCPLPARQDGYFSVYPYVVPSCGAQEATPSCLRR